MRAATRAGYLKQPFKVSKGLIGIEGYHTTFQNPRVLNEPTYLRLSGNSGIQLLGLPFIIDGYFTTEKRTLYNSNHFRVAFDRDAFIRSITDAWNDKKQSLTQDLQRQKSSLGELSNEANRLKNTTDQMQNQQQALQTELKNKQEAFHHQYDQGMALEVRDSARSIWNGKRDSMHAQISGNLNKYKDSIYLQKLINDTQRIHNLIIAYKNQMAAFQEKKAKLDSSVSRDTALIGKYQRLLDNPESSAQAWIKENQFRGPVLVMAAVKDFQTGNVHPFVHEYSLAGLGFRGINTSFGNSKAEFQISGGRGIPLDLYNYDRSSNKYTRNFGSIALKYEWSNFLRGMLFVHHISDPEEKMTQMKKVALMNEVAGLNLLIQPMNLFKLETNLAESRYGVLNNAVIQNNYTAGKTLSGADILKSRGAADLKISRSAGKNAEMMALYKYVGPMFKNLGNPFMRTNFVEYQARVTSKFWKQQLRISAFYKQIHDNPLKILEVTNRTSGYGANFQTQFKNKRLPNFSAGISPYEQGNNHPDSLFRVNSRFSVQTYGMSYRVNKGFLKYNFLAFASRSKMQFNTNTRAVVQTITLSQDIFLGRCWAFGLNYTSMRTPIIGSSGNQAVDSSQADIWQGRVNFTSKQGTSLGISTQYSHYLNGAYRKGIALNFSLKANKHLRTSLRAGYDHYYRLWGMGDRESLWGMCRVEIFW